MGRSLPGHTVGSGQESQSSPLGTRLPPAAQLFGYFCSLAALPGGVWDGGEQHYPFKKKTKKPWLH